MSALASTSRLKVDPPLGEKPVLEWVPVNKLSIDRTYQRSLETGSSGMLIRRIAQFWDWNLCQPLTVARRVFGPLRVVDGQHRLAAARLRGDIEQLPCVIAVYASPGDEAAAFVAINQQRRPLTKLNLFRAALAAGDSSAAAIDRLLSEVGLVVAPHTNYTTWKPGMVSNIAGIMDCYRVHGERVTAAALYAIAEGFKGQIMRYAGTVFPGVYRFIVAEQAEGMAVDRDRLARAVASLSQAEWKTQILREYAETGIRRDIIARVVVERRYADPSPKQSAEPRPEPPPERAVGVKPRPGVEHRPRVVEPETQPKQVWCDQCDRKVGRAKAINCTDKFCDARGKFP